MNLATIGPTRSEADASTVNYDSHNVDELKVLLKEAGKPVSGTKAELIQRLEGE